MHSYSVSSQSQTACEKKDRKKKRINLHFNVFYICIDDDNVYIVHLAHPLAMYSSVKYIVISTEKSAPPS